MCDYSLMNFPNRLAREGEELVVHRFATGSIGMASPVDLEKSAQALRGRSFWERFKDALSATRSCSVPAVCIPPSARLAVYEITAAMQSEFGVAGEEEVRFEQLSAHVNAYRDAIAFRNGRKVRLQELPAGLRMRVVDLGGADDMADDLAAREADAIPIGSGA